jgi:hypothetical protein
MRRVSTDAASWLPGSLVSEAHENVLGLADARLRSAPQALSP